MDTETKQSCFLHLQRDAKNKSGESYTYHFALCSCLVYRTFQTSATRSIPDKSNIVLLVQHTRIQHFSSITSHKVNL